MTGEEVLTADRVTAEISELKGDHRADSIAGPHGLLHRNASDDGVGILQEVDIFLTAILRELRSEFYRLFGIGFGHHEIKTVFTDPAELIHGIAVRGSSLKNHVLNILKGFAVSDGAEIIQQNSPAVDLQDPGFLLFGQIGFVFIDQRLLLIVKGGVLQEGAGDFPLGINLTEY